MRWRAIYTFGWRSMTKETLNSDNWKQNVSSRKAHLAFGKATALHKNNPGARLFKRRRCNASIYWFLHVFYVRQSIVQNLNVFCFCFAPDPSPSPIANKGESADTNQAKSQQPRSFIWKLKHITMTVCVHWTILQWKSTAKIPVNNGRNTLKLRIVGGGDVHGAQSTGINREINTVHKQIVRMQTPCLSHRLQAVQSMNYS